MFRRISAALIAALALRAGNAQQTTLTPNLSLQLPGYNAQNWQVPMYYNFTRLDSILAGGVPIPSLHISGNLIVDGTFNSSGFTLTNAQILASLGFTPLNAANSLSEVTNPSAALANLGGLSLAGGSLSGPLILAGDPVSPLQAATMQYVNNSAGGGIQPNTVAPLSGVVVTATTPTAAPSSGIEISASPNTTPYALVFPAAASTGFLLNTYSSSTGLGAISFPAPQGTGAKVQMATGTPVSGHCADFDSNLNIVDAGAACGTGGSASAVGSAGTDQVTNGSGVLAAGSAYDDAAHKAFTVGTAIAKLPRVDVTHRELSTAGGGSCANSGDPTGANDTYCAVTAAFAFGRANAAAQSSAGGQSIQTNPVYFPPGNYKVSQPIVMYEGEALITDGVKTTTIKNTHPNQPAVVVLPAITPNNAYTSYAYISGFNFQGTGSAGKGSAIEIDTAYVILRDSNFFNFGGIAIRVNNGERDVFQNLSFYNDRGAIMLGGDINETDIGQIHGVAVDRTNDSVAGPFPTFCFGENCSSTGQFPAANQGAGGAPTPLKAPGRGAITIEKAVNVKIHDGDMKDNQFKSAFRIVGGQNVLISSMYAECSNYTPWACLTPSLILGGAAESTTVTSTMTPVTYNINGTHTAYDFTVADASNMPIYFGTLAYLQTNNPNDFNPMILRSSDFVRNSQAASASCPGLLAGQFEQVAGGTYYNANGVDHGYFTGRNNNGLDVYAAITASSVAGNVATLTSANSYAAGNSVTINGLSNVPSLNGLTVTVASATSSQFTAAVTSPNIVNANESAGRADTNTTAVPAAYNWGNCTSPAVIEDYGGVSAAPSVAVENFHSNTVQGTISQGGYIYNAVNGQTQNPLGEIVLGVPGDDDPHGFFSRPNAVGDPFAYVTSTLSVNQPMQMFTGATDRPYLGQITAVRPAVINFTGGANNKDANTYEPFATVAAPDGSYKISAFGLTGGNNIVAVPDGEATPRPVTVEVNAPSLGLIWNSGAQYFERLSYYFSPGYNAAHTFANNYRICDEPTGTNNKPLWCMHMLGGPSNAPSTEFEYNVGPSVFHIGPTGPKFVAGWQEVVQGYSNALAYTVSLAETETRWAPPAGGATLTMPNCAGNQGIEKSLLIDATGNPYSIISGAAQFNIGFVNFNGYNFPGTAVLRGKWNCDGTNWQNTTYMPEAASVSVAAGAGFGTVTSGPTVGTGSTVARGTVAFTTTTAGANASTALTISFGKTLAIAPMYCAVQFYSSGGNTSAPLVTTAQPNTSSCVATAATGIPPGTYTASWVIQ